MSISDEAGDICTLSGVVNFRDIALSAEVRPGRLFRSGELSRLDDDGRKMLQQLGIADVADLRSSGEAARRGPGQVPGGVEIHCLPVPDVAVDATDGDAPHEHAWRRAMAEKTGAETIAAATRYMVEEYRRFPTYHGTQRALREVVKLLGDRRTVLVHCFAGKDRTGLIVALILEAIGVHRNAVLADYLRSNDAMPYLRSQALDMIKQRSDATFITEAQLCDEILGVREEYLATSRQAIDHSFGSLSDYLHHAGIDESHVERLRSALLD